jgi:hypothetical protein
MAPMNRELALAKLKALAAGAALARGRAARGAAKRPAKSRRRVRPARPARR